MPSLAALKLGLEAGLSRGKKSALEEIQTATAYSETGLFCQP